MQDWENHKWFYLDYIFRRRRKLAAKSLEKPNDFNPQFCLAGYSNIEVIRSQERRRMSAMY